MVGDSSTVQGDDRLFRTAIRGLGFSVFSCPYNSRSSYTNIADAFGASVGSVDDTRVAQPLEYNEPSRTHSAVITLVGSVTTCVAVQDVEIGMGLVKKATGAHNVQTSDYSLAFFRRTASV